MCELGWEESWAPKNRCFWTVVLQKTLESPLDYKEIQPVHPKGDQSWVLFGRTDAKAEIPVLWPPHGKWKRRKDSDSWKRLWFWEGVGHEEKGTTEDEMAGWHHRLDGHDFEWTPGVVMYREAWHDAIHGVAKNRTWLSDWSELNWIFWNIVLFFLTWFQCFSIYELKYPNIRYLKILLILWA